MRPFIHDDFLLETERWRATSTTSCARDLPIVDYHCHLLAGADRARTTASARLTEIWLDGDHYKWRAMRTNGVPERLVTGDASDWEKFEAWARPCPRRCATRSTTGRTWS